MTKSTLTSTAFLSRRGSIQVGPGSPTDDVRQVRAQRGTEP